MGILLKNGELFSGCRILSRCGKGSFGITYLAENPIGQKIIIKVVGMTGYSERELNGLRHYMQVSGTHANLLYVSHIGELDEGFYYIMEAADDLNKGGEYYPATLGNLLRQGKCFSAEEAVAITRELLSGINVLHEANLIHRDIKPDNIIFVNGKAKLSDPGLVVEAGEFATFAGSPGFIPPEMISGDSTSDKAADLYAIGKVFYCMVTGNPPKDYPALPERMRLEICRQIFPALSRMCNRNPAKRFKSAGEFLNGLPENIKQPSGIEKTMSDFRDWRILNREKFRRYLCLTFLLLLLVVCVFSYWLFQQEMHRKKLNGYKEKIQLFELVNCARAELLDLQIEVYFPQKLEIYRSLVSELKKNKLDGKWQNAVQTLERLNGLLSSTAQKNLPVIPEKNGDFQNDLIISGKARGYLSTPLAAYLAPSVKAGYSKRLAHFESRLYTGWTGPTCSKEWNTFNDYSHPMIFVPPGAVRMQHSGKTAVIPYHFWIGKHEVPHKHFTHMMGIAPQYSPHSNTPAERIAWNDILYYCLAVTSSMRNKGVLPPGYIVRPPTEAEWEYAAGNAWLGKDTTPFEQRAVFKNNSNRRSMPSGSRQPNKLGIFDIYGNVSEIVLPLEKPAMHNAVMVRGGSYLSTEKKCYARVPYLKYQFIPYDIGFRIVIAPGDMDYFDRQFFVYGPVQLRTRGKVYELIGANHGSFNWKDAEALCRLLGGCLAEFEDQQHLDFFIKNMPLAAGSWGCFIGGKKINGKWQWIHSKKEITFGKWFKSSRPSAGDYLTLRNKRWKAENNYYSGIFLCEWDEKTYPHRNKQLDSGKKLPMELLRFSVGDRNFMLIDSSMLWYAASRFCELLGGRLACLDTPEVKQAVTDKLKKFRNSKILLGGYAKFNKWLWLSGKEITEIPVKDKNMLIPSLNRNFLTLHDGVLCDSQYSQMFLFEWRSSISSSISR